MAKRIEREYTFHISQEELKQEVSIFAPLSRKQEKYLTDDENDIILFGGAAGSGKSHLSLLKLMIDCVENKGYNSYLLRQSIVQIKAPGSIWEEGSSMFSHVNASANQLHNQWRFPDTGSFVKCHYLKGNPNDFQGAQVHSALIDEAAQLGPEGEEDVWYLTSRLRGKGDAPKQLRLTANPSRNSFLCGWLQKGGYLTDTGLPREDMDGVTTFLLQINGEFQFFQSRKEIKELHGYAASRGAYKFVFYSANVYDNPAIVKNDPSYIWKLENMKRLEKERLLYGNWYASDAGMGYLKREDIKEIEPSEVPLNLPEVRAWDLAGTKPIPGAYAKAGGDPDWTRGIRCAYDRNSNSFYILDMESMRDRAALVDNKVMSVARSDGKDTIVCIPQDAGAAGKGAAEAKKSRLLAQGNKPLVMKTNKSKLKRAENFLIAAQNGDVHVVKNVFSDSNWVELEMFDGQKNGGHHDDVIDALSDAYEALVHGRMVPSIKLGKEASEMPFVGKTLLSGAGGML